MPTQDKELRRKPHRPRRNVPSHEELLERASKIKIEGLIIFPETVEKSRESSQARYIVKTKCESCSKEMPQVLTNLERGERKKCRCNSGVRNHPNRIRHTLTIRYRCMVQRCHRVTHVSDANYRGRGIQVHFNSTTDFVEWALEEFPEQALSGFGSWDFDRIDNDGHYSRDNLRLVNRTANLLNRRGSKTTQRARTEEFMEKHPEVLYSLKTVNNLIQQGLTEQEILERHTKNAGVPRRRRSKDPKFRSRAQILERAKVVYPLSHPKHGTTEI